MHLPRPLPRLPRRRALSDREAGFTLIELIGVVGILLILAVVGFPAMSKWLDQQRLLGFVNDASVQLVRARQEAVQRGVPVIAQAQPAEMRLFLWADVDGNCAFNPDPTKVARTVDYQIGLVLLPTQSTVVFGGPGGPAAAIDGLTNVTDNSKGCFGTGLNAFVFERDGSIRDPGGLRITDDEGNFFELRAAPKATGKTRVLKFNPAPSWGDPAGWYEKGNVPSTGAPTWVWNGAVSGGGGTGKGGN
jgi:Tfp pilus assembly protein FimT